MLNQLAWKLSDLIHESSFGLILHTVLYSAYVCTHTALPLMGMEWLEASSSHLSVFSVFQIPYWDLGLQVAG